MFHVFVCLCVNSFAILINLLNIHLHAGTNVCFIGHCHCRCHHIRLQHISILNSNTQVHLLCVCLCGFLIGFTHSTSFSFSTLSIAYFIIRLLCNVFTIASQFSVASHTLTHTRTRKWPDASVQKLLPLFLTNLMPYFPIMVHHVRAFCSSYSKLLVIVV